MPSGNSREIPGSDPDTWFVVFEVLGGRVVVPMGTRVKVTPHGDLVVCMDGGDSRAGWAEGTWDGFRRQGDIWAEERAREADVGPTEGEQAPDAENSGPTTTSPGGVEASPGEEPF